MTKQEKNIIARMDCLKVRTDELMQKAGLDKETASSVAHEEIMSGKIDWKVFLENPLTPDDRKKPLSVNVEVDINPVDLMTPEEKDQRNQDRHEKWITEANLGAPVMLCSHCEQKSRVFDIKWHQDLGVVSQCPLCRWFEPIEIDGNDIIEEDRG